MDGITEEEFLQELQKYKIVRPPTWRGNAKKQVVQQNTDPTPNDGEMFEFDETDGLWTNLKVLLYSSIESGEQAEAVFNNFKQQYDKYVQSLSLDDIEHMLKNWN
mmetsp:Transcript_9161/g.10175  ORF Transcript_9161/g.10175 Transcript_9161/m.10175 type:complete len:105 (+) Transcript_9161:15-329(+)